MNRMSRAIAEICFDLDKELRKAPTEPMPEWLFSILGPLLYGKKTYEDYCSSAHSKIRTWQQRVSDLLDELHAQLSRREMRTQDNKACILDLYAGHTGILLSTKHRILRAFVVL